MLTVFLARWLGDSAFGIYSLAYTIFLLVSLAFTALLIDPLLVFGAGRWRGAYHTYLNRVLIGLGVLSCAGSLLIFGLAQFSHLLDNTGPLKQLLLTLSWAAPIILLMWVLRRALYAIRKPHVAAVGGAIYLVSLLSLAMTINYVVGLSARGAIVVMALASLVSAGFLWKAVSGADVGGRAVIPVTSTKEVLRAHWRYGSWLLGWYVLDWLSTDILYLVLAPVHGTASVGSLRAAMTLILPAHHIFIAVSSVAVPWFVSRIGSRGLSRAMTWFWLAAFGMAGLYCVGLLTFAEQILGLVFGESFHGLRPIVHIAAFIPLTLATQAAFGTVLRALNRTRDLFVASALTALLTATVGAWLSVTNGAVGAVSAFLIGATVNAVVVAIIVRLRLKAGAPGDRLVIRARA